MWRVTVRCSSCRSESKSDLELESLQAQVLQRLFLWETCSRFAILQRQCAVLREPVGQRLELLISLSRKWLRWRKSVNNSIFSWSGWRKMAIYAGSFLLLVGCPVQGEPRQQGQQGGMRGGMQGNNPEMAALRASQQEKLQAFLAEEEAAGKEFMASMAGKPKSELLPALKEFKTRQYEKNCAFREEQYQERLTTVEASFAARAGVSSQMKEKMLARMQENYAAIKTFFAGKHQENMEFLAAAANDASLEGAALNEALQKFFQAQKESAKQFMEQQRSRMQR